MTEDKKTEAKILDSALEVFVKKGRHGAKMQEIADKAGINKALVHYYYRNKENLYAKILEMVFRRFFPKLEKALSPDNTFAEQLRTIINAYVDLLNRNRHIPVFMAKELSEGGETVSRVISGLMQDDKIKFPRLLFEAIEKAIESGEIRKIDPRQFILTLIGSCIFYAVARPIVFAFLNDNDEMNTKDFIEKRKDAIFDILYYGLKPRENQS